MGKHTYIGSKFNPERSNPLTSCTPLNPIWKPHNLYPEQMMLSNVEPQSVDKAGEIIWTYDVKWEPSDIRWASRWDLYMYMGEDQVHWFSIVNSLLVVIFLSGMVAMIMIRALNNDILTYNDVDQEEMREETGWKLVHVMCSDHLVTPTCWAVLLVQAFRFYCVPSSSCSSLCSASSRHLTEAPSCLVCFSL